MSQQQSKYFTPEIEDIRVGYECETRVEPYPNWVKSIIATGDDLNYIQWAEWEIRVPYLTTEQIEAEGWKEIEVSNSDLLVFGNFLKFEKDERQMSFFPNKMEIAIWTPFKIAHYHGECKDINTFRYITKLLNI